MTSTSINNTLPTGWPPVYNWMSYSGMDPESARAAAWKTYYNSHPEANPNAANPAVQQTAAPEQGKPMPTSTLISGPGMKPGGGVGQAAIDALMAQRDAGAAANDAGGSAGGGLKPMLSSNQGGYSMTSSGLQYGSTQPSGAVRSQTATGPTSFTTGLGGAGGAPGSDLMASLTGQASGDYTKRLADYKNLIASIMGPQGFLSQLGASGERRIAENQAQQTGKTEQDLISRGLGNTTIRANMLGGVAKNAENARQDLGERVATQKAGTAMQLFGMDPTPNTETYLNMLMRLSGASR